MLPKFCLLSSGVCHTAWSQISLPKFSQFNQVLKSSSCPFFPFITQPYSIAWEIQMNTDKVKCRVGPSWFLYILRDSTLSEAINILISYREAECRQVSAQYTNDVQKPFGCCIIVTNNNIIRCTDNSSVRSEHRAARRGLEKGWFPCPTLSASLAGGRLSISNCCMNE